MPGRLREALGAGFITLLLGLLCTAALATPVLAAAPDFGHTHPHGTSHHLHPLNLVLGGTVPPTPVVSVSPTPYEGRTPPPPASPHVPAEAPASTRSRAPPAQTPR